MLSAAKITVMGHLGRDPETRYTPNGAMNVTFSVAVSNKYKETENTNWFRVTAWGKLAETMDALSQQGALVKGSGVVVMGSFQQRSYVTNEGSPGTSLDINADLINIASQSGNSNQSGHAGASSGSHGTPDYNNFDDVPF